MQLEWTCISMTNLNAICIWGATGKSRIAEFDKLCKEHDLTYSYSDDHSAYTKGHEHHKKIMELSKEIPHNIAVQIWNKYVFEKLSEHYIEEYLWK